MRLLLPLAALLLLTWQAGEAVLVLAHGAATRAAIPWQLRLCATTDERIRRALGADAELLFALRGAVAPGSLLITQKVEGRVEDIRSVAEFERLSAKNGLLLQLTTLLYPDPFLLPASHPIPTVEDLVRHGHAAALCVLPGDADPGTRPGWSLVPASPPSSPPSSPHFQLWRFRTE